MSLLDKHLILVAGKGGVGRSTVAAAIASSTSRAGRKTLLIEANANDRYGDFFGGPEVGPEMVKLGDHLFAINTNPGAALEEYGLMILRFRRVYRMVFENRVTRYFLRAIPGLDDYSILGKMWFHATKERWDTIVFDLPASGHSLSMLRIPSVILDTVPEGPLTRDARDVRRLLTSTDETALVCVTLAEEMPAAEARELTETLATELAIPTQHLVVNQTYPDRFPEGSAGDHLLDRVTGPEAENLAPELAAFVAHADLIRHRRRLNERYLAELADTVKAPQIQLPMLFVPTLGPAEIRTLSGELAAALS